MLKLSESTKAQLRETSDSLLGGIFNLLAEKTEQMPYGYLGICHDSPVSDASMEHPFSEVHRSYEELEGLLQSWITDVSAHPEYEIVNATECTFSYRQEFPHEEFGTAVYEWNHAIEKLPIGQRNSFDVDRDEVAVIMVSTDEKPVLSFAFESEAIALDVMEDWILEILKYGRGSILRLKRGHAKYTTFEELAYHVVQNDTHEEVLATLHFDLWCHPVHKKAVE